MVISLREEGFSKDPGGKSWYSLEPISPVGNDKFFFSIIPKALYSEIISHGKKIIIIMSWEKPLCMKYIGVIYYKVKVSSSKKKWWKDWVPCVTNGVGQWVTSPLAMTLVWPWPWPILQTILEIICKIIPYIFHVFGFVQK